MIIKIENEELVKALENVAENEGKDVNEIAEELLGFSIDNAIATLAMRRLEFAIVDTMIPILKDIQVNTYAARHQVTNMHADILEEPERAIKISEEATTIGQKIAFEDEEEKGGE